MFTVFYRDAWHFLRLQTERDSSTDNLKYMDRIETQGGCVTRNERIDLKQKVKTRNRKNELKRKDGHDTQGTRKEPKVMNPKKETTGET